MYSSTSTARARFLVPPGGRLCRLLVLIVGLAVLYLAADSGRGEIASPYGLCAHVSRGADHRQADEQFALMRQAQIAWTRTDFDWTTLQREKEGPWRFEVFDETVAGAAKHQITILPILDYDVSWARPAYRHLDLWREYVRRTVGRYSSRLPCWEVWNEPNLEQFWKEKPDAENYALLLKAAHEEIKAIDPDLTVLLGGLAGIPLDFIEGLYQAGARDYFDVMNVHPYRYPQAPEQGNLVADLEALRRLMSRYGDQDKPIWITEIGWPTHRPDIELTAQIVRAGLQELDGARDRWTMAVLDDPQYPVRNPFSRADWLAMLPAGGSAEAVLLKDLPDLSVAKYNVLLLPPAESFPADYFEALEGYVRRGGILILTHGVPLYYSLRREPDDTWKRQGVDDSYRRRLRIGWEAWWTRQDVPRQSTRLQVPEGLKDRIHPPAARTEASRFLTDQGLESADRLIRLLTVEEGSYRGVVAAAIDLKGTLKGGLIVSTLQQDFRGVSPETQARILPRAYLLSFQAGVEKVFWYNFRAFENNLYYNEDHFGILHRDLSPKPAYEAMQTLIRVRPAGSRQRPIAGQQANLYCLSWQRPDGRVGWALWQTGGAESQTLVCQGPLQEAYGHRGNPLEFDRQGQSVTLKLDDAPLYLIGPQVIKAIPKDR
ncbi:MAG: hypothetical protein JW810_03380 [Sedimentisphaerales bacterium]|nr:hypothetical protein [Sedimentisphaerales bacterium]